MSGEMAVMVEVRDYDPQRIAPITDAVAHFWEAQTVKVPLHALAARVDNSIPNLWARTEYSDAITVELLNGWRPATRAALEKTVIAANAAPCTVMLDLCNPDYEEEGAE